MAVTQKKVFYKDRSQYYNFTKRKVEDEPILEKMLTGYILLFIKEWVFFRNAFKIFLYLIFNSR